MWSRGAGEWKGGDTYREAGEWETAVGGSTAAVRGRRPLELRSEGALGH